MSSSSFAFDELPRGAGGTGATEAINQVLHDAGLDAPASLYDEALALAREGRLAPAAERLRMVLVLDPADAEAALLLGKVLAGIGRWQEALTWLDAASANGAVLPAGLRDEVEQSLRQEVQDAEAERQRLQARERGEVRNLRQEAKRLRSENALLEQRLIELDKRVKLWSGATALVAGSASALLLAAMVFGGPKGPETLAAVPEASVEAMTEAEAPAAVAGAPVVAEVKPGSASAPVAAAQPEIKTIDPVAQGTPAAAPKATATAAKAEPKPARADKPSGAVLTTHTVKSGETLGILAQKYYGRSSDWKKILDANESQLHGSTKSLQVGMKLKIPK